MGTFDPVAATTSTPSPRKLTRPAIGLGPSMVQLTVSGRGLRAGRHRG